MSSSEIQSYNLAAKYRPRNLDDFVGQDQAVSSYRDWETVDV